jgi:hypothetical protein
VPRIPTYESSISLPTSVGGYKRNTADQAVADAGENFGNALMQFAQRKEEREQRTAILAAKNEFQQRSLEEWEKTKQERQGQAALANEQTGFKGVYQNYNDNSRKWKDELLSKHGVNKRYRDKAIEHLGYVENSYRRKFAAWESTQIQEWRRQTLQDTQDVAEKQLASDLQAGGGVEEINIAIANMNEQIEFIVGPTGNAQAVKNGKRVAAATITKTALSTLLHDDPIRTKEILADDKIKKVLEPSDLVTLTELAEKERVPFEADKETDRIESIAGTPASQLELAQDIDDDDVRNAVISNLTHKHAVQDKIDNEKQFDRLERYYNRIFNDGENVSIASIDKDGGLEPTQKLQVKSWLRRATGGEDGEKTNRLNQWFLAYEKVLSGDWQELDLMRAANQGQLDPSDAKSLMTEVGKVREVPSLGKAVETLKGDLRDIFKDDQDKARFMKVLYQDVLEFRSVNKRNPSYNEIVKMGTELAQPDIEKATWDFGSFPDLGHYSQEEQAIIKATPEATTERYRRENRQTYIQREVNKIRKAGEWPNAIWDEEQNVFYLGKREGYHYYLTVDGQKMREKAN